jgi:CheY-like chemotaxis protein
MAQRTIMVVDDEAIIREFMEEVLGGAGHEVRSAENGERALEMLKREPFQIVFLDLGPGMEGLSLCREIRKDHPLTLLHATTKHPSAFELAAARAVGFDDYFVKPLEAQEVLQATVDSLGKIDRWNSACDQG